MGSSKIPVGYVSTADAHTEFFLRGWGGDPEAMYDLCLILKLT
jgi:hypothetical protein